MDIISYLNDEKIIGTSYEKELQKKNQTKFRVQKVIKRKVAKLYVKLKAMIVRLIVVLIKKIRYIKWVILLR